MEWLRLLVLSICVLAFIACVVGGLLVLFEKWHPENTHTRKFLVGGVLLSAVGAVTPQAGNLFGVGASGSEPTTGISQPINAPPSGSTTANQSVPEETDTAPPPEPTGDQVEEEPADGAGGDQPEEGVETVAQASRCVIDPPSTVAEFALGLGDRPQPACATGPGYPKCVASLRSRNEGETISAEGEDCAREVMRWRRDHIAKIYSLKAEYQPNLDNAELETRPRRDFEPNAEWRAYVIAEINRLNGPGWETFLKRDATSKKDMAGCFEKACRQTVTVGF